MISSSKQMDTDSITRAVAEGTAPLLEAITQLTAAISAESGVDPGVITADAIRCAKKQQLVSFAYRLGVTAESKELGEDFRTLSVDTLRSRCLNALRANAK